MEDLCGACCVRPNLPPERGWCSVSRGWGQAHPYSVSTGVCSVGGGEAKKTSREIEGLARVTVGGGEGLRGVRRGRRCRDAQVEGGPPEC